MFNNLIKAISKPAKAFRFLSFTLHYLLRKKEGTLIYIGMDPNGTFNLMHLGFKQCYGFEANPERYAKLQKRYGNNPRIQLFNMAVADMDGEITFNISSNNNGASSSIGTFNDNWNEEYNGEKITMVKSITVPCVNLYNFCKKNNIGFIEEYFSDIQGFDLTALSTLKPMIDKKQIRYITCEVASNNKGNVYKDLPDNSEKGFANLLGNNYKMIAKGWGALRNGKFDKIPEDAWEYDCKWQSIN
ncbi:MAG: FkbM family methyltransferase [Bacteroidales bacterium]|nr:FkbM family methyltransferase [Bacteroidales bacterium]